MKTRLDSFLFQAGLVESRSEARAAIMEGLVSVNRDFNVKPGTQVTGNEDICITPRNSGYVSRGGIKLESALDVFKMEINGQTVLDVGASTGGFTDCLLDHGASRVISLDVGKGQLHWKLRNDSRVRVIEGFNARYLQQEDIPEKPSLATIDVSFISLRKIILPVAGVLAKDWKIVALVKPQFEAGREKVGKGGVVRDPETHEQVLAGIIEWIFENGMSAEALAESPIKGPKGNIEYFILIRKGWDDRILETEIKRVVKKAYSELK